MGAVFQRGVQAGGDLDGLELAGMDLPVAGLAGSAQRTAAGKAVIRHGRAPEKGAATQLRAT